jgi:acetyl esterase/lipase
MPLSSPPGTYEVTVDDRVFAEPEGVTLLARCYRPVGAPFGHLLVDVHGGAWTYFDRTVDAYPDHALASAGLTVVALDFRMGSAHPFEAAVADVVGGIRWAKAHAAELGARPDRVGLIGGSSGGHLLMLAALTPRAFAGTIVDAPDDVDASVAYALPLWPILDPLARYRYLRDRIANPTPVRDSFFQAERLIDAHHGFFGDEATMGRASALRVVEDGEHETLPPIWIAHPELDENVTLPMTERFVDAYRRAGGAVELAVFSGVGHAFANLPGEPADACIAQMHAFIARQLV